MRSCRPFAAARSPRSCGCARRFSATLAQWPRKLAIGPTRTSSTAMRSNLLDANYPGTRRAAQFQSAARRLSCAQRSAGNRRSDVQRHRPFAARHQQPTAKLRQRAPALCRSAAQEGRRSQGDSRDFCDDPADGAAGPRTDPGGARPRADRRHRRSLAPIPPVGHLDSPGRAFPYRARAAPGSRQAEPAGSGARPRPPGDARHVAEGAADDAVGAVELPAVPGGFQRHDLACRPPENPSPRRSLLPHDHRWRSRLCDADHAGGARER